MYFETAENLPELPMSARYWVCHNGYCEQPPCAL